jgi:hypothetical protein
MKRTSLLLVILFTSVLSFGQSYDLPCQSGSTPLLAPTQNPATGNYRAWVCVDPAGTVTSPVFALIDQPVTKLTTKSSCTSSASPAVCGANSTGAVALAASATTLEVDSSAVTAGSQIILTRDDSLGTLLTVTCDTQSSLVVGTPRVSARTTSTSFTISTDVGTTTNPMCISYLIVN